MTVGCGHGSPRVKTILTWEHQVVSRHRTPEPVFRVLVVCTGNVCRSALAERLGRAYLAEAAGKDAEAIRLTSAGVRAVAGSAMHPDSALVLRGLGGNPAGFLARQFHADMAIDSDLILTMTRQHRSHVLRSAPRALNRTFTLREAAGLITSLSAEEDLAGAGLADRSRALVQRMSATRSSRHGSPADDVPDPIGRPVEVHEQVGGAIAAALLPVLARIISLHPQARDATRRPVASDHGRTRKSRSNTREEHVGERP
ncbi:arsenate reductase/protein-tyrosine-phosphatase family protein [Blastococcus sp. SYSU D01042]